MYDGDTACVCVRACGHACVCVCGILFVRRVENVADIAGAGGAVIVARLHIARRKLNVCMTKHFANLLLSGYKQPHSQLN